MIDAARLKDLLSKQEYSRLDKILLCLAVDDTQSKQVKEIKDLAVSAGLREIKNGMFRQAFLPLMGWR